MNLEQENERRVQEACKEYVEDSMLHFYDSMKNRSPEIAVFESTMGPGTSLPTRITSFRFQFDRVDTNILKIKDTEDLVYNINEGYDNLGKKLRLDNFFVTQSPELDEYNKSTVFKKLGGIYVQFTIPKISDKSETYQLISKMEHPVGNEMPQTFLRISAMRYLTDEPFSGYHCVPVASKMKKGFLSSKGELVVTACVFPKLTIAATNDDSFVWLTEQLSSGVVPKIWRIAVQKEKMYYYTKAFDGWKNEFGNASNTRRRRTEDGQEEIFGVDYLKGIPNPMVELDSLIGLNAAKNKIKTFQKRMLYQKMLEEVGDATPNNFNNHMIFYGPPGTGKTTVARIMAGLLYELGLVKKNKCIQVNGEQIKGQYVGQTGKQVQKIINQALGGVLFIDEAYAMDDEYYGKEAVNVLLQNLEDHKDNLIVILAGYENEMKGFVKLNPGLASRIGDWVEFQDYTPEELLGIAIYSFEKRGFQVTDNAKKVLEKYFEMSYDSGRTRNQGGNARFVENIVNDLLDAHAINIIDGNIDKDKYLKTICTEDLRKRK